jgi:thymidylate synthase
MKVFSNFTDAYYDLLFDVYKNPDFTSAPRGQKIREKLGVSFRILNPLDRLPYIEQRDFSISYFVAESLWYLSGNDSTDWISNYSSFWKNISDDGTTANSAYGARIFKPHARIASGVNDSWTQWDYVLNELLADPDSRRAVVHIRSPQDSLLATKDVPCTLSLQFFLRNDKVHMIVSMRSSDLILGIAYDVPAFTLFQELLANQLSEKLNRKIDVGEYTHVSNSLHIYEKHFKMVDEILNKREIFSVEMPRIPRGKIPLDEILEFENKCRNSQTINELKSLISGLDMGSEYWNDWCKILMSHRANKLNFADFEKMNLLASTEFSGYKFFNK